MAGKPGQHSTLKRINRRGQGVIEYAGALVLAAVLVSLAIFIVPTEVAGMINNIVNSSMTYFTGQLPGGGS